MNSTFLSHLRFSRIAASEMAPLPAVSRPKPPQPQRRIVQRVLFSALAVLVLCCTTALHAQKTSYVDANLTPYNPTYIDAVTAYIIIRDQNTGTGINQSGSVTVAVDGGTAKTGIVTASVAYVNLGELAIGNHSVVVNFPGNASYAASTASTTVQVTDAPFTFVGTQGNTLFLDGSVLGVQGVAVDAADNLYIADQSSNLVEKEDLYGNVTKLPFTGLSGPTGLALDTAGNLYVADTGNNRILKMNTSGTQTAVTVAGLNGPTYLAYDRNNDILYISDPKNGRVVKFPISSGTQSDAITGLTKLQSIAVTYQGFLLVADVVQGFIEVQDGTQIQLYGNIREADGITSDPFGNVFLSDGATNTLLRMDPTGTQIQVNNGNNPVTSMASDSHGRIYLALGGRVDVIAPSSGRVPDIGVTNGGVGNGGTSSLIYEVPQAQPTFTVAVAPAKLFQPVASTTCVGAAGMCYQYISFAPQSAGFNEGYVTTKMGSASSTLPLWGVGLGGSAAFSTGVPSQISSGASAIGGVALDIAGNRYVVDTQNKAVFKVPAAGGPVKLAFTGLQSPTQVAVDASGGVYVLDTGLVQILRLDPSGTQTVSYDGSYEGNYITNPTAFALDGDTNLVLAGTGDGGSDALHAARKSGGSQARRAAGSSGGGVSVARSVRLDLPSLLLASFVYGQPFTSSLGPVLGVAIDAEENVYALESSGNVWEYNPAGTTTELATGLSGAAGFGVDPAGNAYVVHSSNSTVTIVHPDKSTTNLSFNGLYGAASVTVDPYGDLLVGDAEDKQLLFLDRTQQNYIFGNQNVGTTSYAAAASVSNIGNQPFTFSGTLPTNGTFAPATSTGECNPAGTPATTLAPAASCDLSYIFTPPSVGPFTYSGSLTTTPPTLFASTGLGAMNFSGTGVAATTTPAPIPVLTPASITFASLAVGATSAPQTATLSNTGNETLNIMSFGFFGINAGSFAETNTCGSTLAAGQSCSIAITCTPSTSGALAGDLGANFPSPLPQQFVNLFCTGAAAAANPTPQAALTPATANFGSVTTGMTGTAQTFTLANAGGAALAITSVSLSGTNASAFTIASNPCGTSVAAGASCIITVTFSPTSASSATATLSVADNASGSPQTSTLTGTGTAPAAVADFTIAATPATQSVAGGSPAAYNVMVASSGSAFTSAVAFTASGLPPGATVSFAPASVTPGTAGAQSVMTVQTVALQASRSEGSSRLPFGAPVLAVALLLLPFGSRKRISRGIVCVLMLAGIAGALTGCGGGFALPQANPTTYTITVTGTSGTTQHSTSVQITVR